MEMEWVRGEILGHGSFGTVNLAKRRKISPDGSKLMAVKTCGLSQISSLRNEKAILDEFKDCPEIIKCYGDCDSLEDGEKLYNVLLEYASGGTLFDKLKNCIDRRLPENEVRRYLKSILKGVDCIHKKGYVHCDIKLQNILLNQFGEIKIADFGLGKKSEEGNLGCELRGTPMYMSPEMVVGGIQESPADIWAIGCLMIEMLTGAPIWDCTDLSALLMKIGVDELAPEIPAKLSEEGKDFIQCCFIKDPKKRWTAEMLLRHPFIAPDHDRHRCDPIKITSTSPTSGFEFSDWVSEQSSFTPSITPLSSPESSSDSFSWFSNGGSKSDSAAERLRGLVSDQEPNWTCSDDWITIR